MAMADEDSGVFPDGGKISSRWDVRRKEDGLSTEVSYGKCDEAADRNGAAGVMRAEVIAADEHAPWVQPLRVVPRASMGGVAITSAGKPTGVISRASMVRWFLENRWNVLQFGASVLNDEPQPVATTATSP